MKHLMSLSLSVALLAGFTGCTWGPWYDDDMIAKWSPDCSSVVIGSREGARLYADDGRSHTFLRTEEFISALGEEYADDWGYPARAGWIDSDTLLHVLWKPWTAEPDDPIPVSIWSRDSDGRWRWRQDEGIRIVGESGGYLDGVWQLLHADHDGTVAMRGRWKYPLPGFGPQSYEPDYNVPWGDIICSLNRSSGDFALTLVPDNAGDPVYDAETSRWWWCRRDPLRGTMLESVSHTHLPGGVVEADISLDIPIESGDWRAWSIDPRPDGTVIAAAARLGFAGKGAERTAIIERYVCDPRMGSVVKDHEIEFPDLPHNYDLLTINPACTVAAYFGERGELVFRSIEDGSVRVVHHPHKHWIRIEEGVRLGWDESPLDGRTADPVWLDDHSLFTLWHCEDKRDRLDLVVWDVSGPEIRRRATVCADDHETWPKHLTIYQGFFDTL